tara:strand:+ start:1482 stop:2342 length:861 start_codon:yes stop_codon:yes gene_type:complete
MNLVSLSYIPHHVSRKCFLSGLMTNGVTLTLRYQCLEAEKPVAYNALKLAEAGYSSLLEPKRTVKVGRRGAYRHNETGRAPVLPVPKENLEDYFVLSVYPGQKKPICVSEIALENHTCIDHEGLLQEDGFDAFSSWDRDGSSFNVECGRALLRKREKQRRVRNKAYAEACAELAKECRRTSSLNVMDSYLRAENTFFLVLGKERMRIQRKKLDHHRKNQTRSALARLSNELLGLGKGKRADGKKSIVFFGNGSRRPSPRGRVKKGSGSDAAKGSGEGDFGKGDVCD